MSSDPREWLLRTVSEAYHGDKPPHPFEECGDPFCSEAYDRAVALINVVDAVRRRSEHEAAEAEAAAAIAEQPDLFEEGRAHIGPEWDVYREAVRHRAPDQKAVAAALGGLDALWHE